MHSRAMEKTFKFLSVIAVVALTLASCKQELNPAEKENGTHKVTIIPSMTKTVIDESGDKATVNWTTNETVHAYENGYKATEAILVSNDNGRTAIINAEFTDKAAATYTYNAIVAKSVSDSKNPLLSNTQTATATSFDSDADILISSFSEPVAESTDEISLYFARPVVINKMTLQGLTEGEKIKEVEFTATCNLAGRFSINFDSGNVSEYGVSEQKKNIIVSYGNNEVAAADGTFPVYFVTFPTLTETGCGDFSVVVRTNKYIYTKNISGKKLEFKLNTLTKFKMDLSTADKEEVHEPVAYTLVSSNSDLCDGAQYLIVGAGSSSYYAMGAQKTNNRNAISVPNPVEKVITIDNTYASLYQIDKTQEGWTIKDIYEGSEEKGHYLYAAGTATSGTNYLKSQDTPHNWEITITDGVAQIKSATNTKTPYMRFNDGNSKLFTCYASETQTAVSLYVDKTTCIEKIAAPEIEVVQTGAGEVTVVWGNVDHAIEYTVSCDDASETYAAGEDLYEHSFTGLSNKNYTIVVEAVAESGWRNNSSSEEITVVNVNLANPSVVFEGISTSAFTAKWSAVNNAASYNYYVADADGNRLPAYNDDVNTENLTFTVEDGLAAGTTYKVFIKTVAPSESIFVAPENYAEFDVTTEQAGVTYSYKQVTSITDGEYIIVNSTYYLPSTQCTASSPIAGSIQITNNKVSSTISEDMKWTIVTSGDDGKTLTITNASGHYLYVSGTSNNTQVRINSQSTARTWTVTAYPNATGAFYIKDNTNNRYCASYNTTNGADWRSYNSYNASNYNDSGKLYFYKKTSDAPATPLSAPANLTCSAQSEDQLTFTWSAVSNATGYKVSIDGGNTYGDLINTTSYTWTNLAASTEYTLYVKAIGDGETWSDSEASHASGTTYAATVWNLKSIAVTTQPTKTTYSVGDNFDPAGMVVTATYSDAAGKKADKTAPVTGYTILDGNNLQESTTSVTVSYKEGDITQTATVTGLSVSSGTDYSIVYTSNIQTYTKTSGTLTTEQMVKVLSTDTGYDAWKLGKGTTVVTFSVPAGTKKIHIHAAAWNRESGTIEMKAGTTKIGDTWTLTADSGVANSSPFTLNQSAKASSDYYKCFELSNATAASTTITLTFTCDNKRCVYWGVNAE